MAPSAESRTIAANKKAFHDYFVEEALEAGIELSGTEVKSLRQGGVNLKMCIRDRPIPTSAPPAANGCRKFAAWPGIPVSCPIG